MKSCLGRIEADPVGRLLGTGYSRFYSPYGLDGLYRVSDGRLDLLALDAQKPGKGQFRAFIQAAKLDYSRIFVWHVANPFLPAVLERYGFRAIQAAEMVQGQLEYLDGYRWDK